MAQLTITDRTWEWEQRVCEYIRKVSGFLVVSAMPHGEGIVRLHDPKDYTFSKSVLRRNLISFFWPLKDRPDIRWILLKKYYAD